MLCDACEKVRFPCEDNKDRKQAGHATAQRKAADNRSQRLGSEGAASRLMVAPDDVQTTKKADGENFDDSTRFTSATTAKSDVVINELLAYVQFFRNKANGEALKRTVLGFYSATDICCAKKSLIQKLHSHLECCALTAERRSSSARPAHEAEVEDICGIFDALDTLNVLMNCTFVAANFDNLPKFGPEELNIAAVVDRQVHTDATIRDMSVALNQLMLSRDCGSSDAGETAKQIAAIQSDVDGMNQSITSLCARFDHLNNICANAFKSAEIQRIQPAAAAADADRKFNVVIFGVKEDRNADVWHQSVVDILHYVIDRDVDIADMYRLGRFNTDKTRPVLVKLRVVWDVRLILSKRSKLKHYSQSGVFIAPDEPLAERRKNALEQMKFRAERAGKSVVVVNDVLSIDGTAVFSLSGGRIHNA
jgi:hypothetical protein